MPEMLGVQTWHVPLWRILHRAVDSIGACLSALPGTPVLCRQDETKPEVKSRLFFFVFFLLCFLIKAGNKRTTINPTRQSKQNQTKADLYLLPFLANALQSAAVFGVYGSKPLKKNRFRQTEPHFAFNSQYYVIFF